MQEQTYVIENNKTFNLEHIFECGQCFRWNKKEHNTYIGIFKNNILEVKNKDNKIIFKGICEGEIEKVVSEYFDLTRNYEQIKEELSKIDDNVKKSIEYGNGIRILNQDLWEMIVSFIISANNNIPRIKGIIERLCENYGKPIQWNNNIYYTFPTPEELKDATVEDFRKIGLGFRDIRLYETIHMILDKKIDLEEIKNEADTSKVREQLLKLSGVGPKVADCILLFSTLKRFEVFPIDVWVRRIINELYIKNPDETKVNKKDIEIIAKNKFGSMAGIVQQYFFYWKREA